jgi:hypothetical protein
MPSRALESNRHARAQNQRLAGLKRGEVQWLQLGPDAEMQALQLATATFRGGR